MTCQKHRYYKAVLPPKVLCRACWVDYLKAHPEQVNKFAIAIRKLNIQPTEYGGPAPQEDMKIEALRTKPVVRNVVPTTSLASSQVKKLAAAGIQGSKRANAIRAREAVTKSITPDGIESVKFIDGKWIKVDPKLEAEVIKSKPVDEVVIKQQESEIVDVETRGGMTIVTEETIVGPTDGINITPPVIEITEEKEEEPKAKKGRKGSKKTKTKKNEE